MWDRVALELSSIEGSINVKTGKSKIQKPFTFDGEGDKEW